MGRKRKEPEPFAPNNLNRTVHSGNQSTKHEWNAQYARRVDGPKPVWKKGKQPVTVRIQESSDGASLSVLIGSRSIVDAYVKGEVRFAIATEKGEQQFALNFHIATDIYDFVRILERYIRCARDTPLPSAMPTSPKSSYQQQPTQLEDTQLSDVVSMIQDMLSQPASQALEETDNDQTQSQSPESPTVVKHFRTSSAIVPVSTESTTNDYSSTDARRADWRKPPSEVKVKDKEFIKHTMTDILADGSFRELLSVVEDIMRENPEMFDVRI